MPPLKSRQSPLQYLQKSILAKESTISESRSDVELPQSLTVEDDNLSIYADYPLLHSMLLFESVRNKYFEKATKKLKEYPRSTDAWFKTLFVVKGRALDRIYLPWAIVTVNAIFWSVIIKRLNLTAFDDYNRWQLMYAIVANSTLAFLLVFRLNRIAMRFWETRTMWGKILVNSRALVSSILVHGSHNRYDCDRAIAYVGAFAVATKHYIRGEKIFPDDELVGLLKRDELYRLEISPHSALHASNKIREHLKQVFMITTTTPVQYAASWSIQLQLLEEKINTLLEQLGGMEKVRSTPLPLVYVSHLRTCLMIYLLTLPLVWTNLWGWSTVLIIGVTAFALLGVEAAASECEIPFDKNRTNHLELDAYCYMVIKSIQQILKDNADVQIKKYIEETPPDDMEAGSIYRPSVMENLINENQMKQSIYENYREPWNGWNDQVSILVDEYPPISEVSISTTPHGMLKQMNHEHHSRDKFFSVDAGRKIPSRPRFLT